MSKVKMLRIHTIPGIFNRLSASATSQALVVTQLLEKIVAASKERIPELLRYTLCKVAAQLISQAQSEFFIIEDEAQSLPVSMSYFRYPPTLFFSLSLSHSTSLSVFILLVLSIPSFLYFHKPFDNTDCTTNSDCTGILLFLSLLFSHLLLPAILSLLYP